MMRLWNFLAGKKTYLAAALTAALAALEASGVNLPPWLWPLLAALGIASLRAGVALVGGQPPRDLSYLANDLYVAGDWIGNPPKPSDPDYDHACDLYRAALCARDWYEELTGEKWPHKDGKLS